jgi:hypothetical protein
MLFHAHVSAHANVPKYEVEAEFSALNLASYNTRTQVGFGGWFTCNPDKNFVIEAAGDFYPYDDEFSTFRHGGQFFEGLFGLKAGKCWDKFGLFAKARPGFITFTRALPEFTPTGTVNTSGVFNSFDFHTRSATHFTTDLGGVLELYTSRHIVTRFDAGTTIIRYGATNAPFLLGSDNSFVIDQARITGETTFNFVAGVGYRF